MARVAALSLALGGCAALTSSTPSEPGAVPPAVAPRIAFRGAAPEQAEALERDGQLRRAAEEWKIALAIAPGGRAGARIPAGAAGTHRQVLPSGSTRGARRSPRRARRGASQFLAALALDTSNRARLRRAPERHARGGVHHPHRAGVGHADRAWHQRYYATARGRGDLEDQPLPPIRPPGRGHHAQDSRDPRRCRSFNPEARRPAPAVAAIPLPTCRARARPRARGAGGAPRPGGVHARGQSPARGGPRGARAQRLSRRHRDRDKFLGGKPGDARG